MSNDKHAAEGAGAAAAKPTPPMVLGGVAVGALAAGLALGLFVLGPMFGPKPASAAKEPAESGEHGKKDEKGGHGKEKVPVFRLENVIVNPSGTQGTRFLMTTVAMEVDDSKLGDALRAHELEIRDAVVTTLESRTLEELTRDGARDSLKAAILEQVNHVMGEEVDVRIYLPQFVIQ